MPSHVALLRGINVGGRNLVAMSKLRELLEALGMSEVQTLLQSGNVTFRCDQPKGDALEQLLETETKKRLGATADYLVRTAKEWSAIVAANPFPKEARLDPSHLVVVALKKAPVARNVKALQAANKGPEIIRAAGRQLYIFYPAGIGRSKLSGTLIERTLGVRGTARNWNTVLKLNGLLDQSRAKS